MVWRPQPRQAGIYAAAGAGSAVRRGGRRRQERRAGDRGAAAGAHPALPGAHPPQDLPAIDRPCGQKPAVLPPGIPAGAVQRHSHVWVFPSGAKIYFGSLQYTKDRTNYQGKAFDFIGFDELTHFEWEEYSYLMSRNRPTGPGTRVYMRATTNPGGVGTAGSRPGSSHRPRPVRPSWKNTRCGCRTARRKS